MASRYRDLARRLASGSPDDVAGAMRHPDWKSVAVMGEQSPAVLAAQAGNVAALSAMLDGGVSPNTCAPKLRRSLVWAAASGGQPEAVRALLERGGDPCSRDARGVCAALEAATRLSMAGADRDAGGRYLRCVELLLQAGADPCEADRMGFSAVHVALDEPGLMEAVFRSLGEGTPRARRWATAALLEAAGSRLAERVRLAGELLRRGADARARDARGRTCAWHACSAGNVHMLREVARDARALAEDALAEPGDGEVCGLAVAVANAAGLRGESWDVVAEVLAAARASMTPAALACALLEDTPCGPGPSLAWSVALFAPEGSPAMAELAAAVGQHARPPAAEGHRWATSAARESLCSAVIGMGPGGLSGVGSALQTAVRLNMPGVAWLLARHGGQGLDLDLMLARACELRDGDGRPCGRRLAEALVDAGARPMRSTASVTNGLFAAVRSGWPADDVRWLLQTHPGRCPDEGCVYGVSALSAALNNPDPRVARELMTRYKTPPPASAFQHLDPDALRRGCRIAWGLLREWEARLVSELPHRLAHLASGARP